MKTSSMETPFLPHMDFLKPSSSSASSRICFAVITHPDLLMMTKEPHLESLAVPERRTGRA